MNTPTGPGGEDRVAIVTGGSRSIGRACAVRLARDGYAVVINFATNHEEADKAVAEVAGAGGRAVAAQGDVADEHEMAGVFDVAAEHFGHVDTVVHAAGRMPLSTVADLDLDVLDSVHRTNIRGTFVVDQLAARRLRDGGAVVNFSTSVVGLAFPTYGAYTASKGAVEALTRVLAKELGPRGISVNAVAPGPTATDLFLADKSDDDVARLTGTIPLGRLAEPDEIADVVAFLCGPGGHWISGQVVRANGGMV